MDQQKHPLHVALMEAISNALENMAFEETEMADEHSEIPETPDQLLWISLPVVKPISGAVVLRLSEKCAQRITGDIYADLDIGDITEDSIMDALGEILNTIVGRFLTILLPAEQSFDLGFPKTGKGDPPFSKNKIIASLIVDASGYILTGMVVGEDFRRFLIEDPHKAEVRS